MALNLATIRCPDDVAPERRAVGGGEFTIGRGPDNDWVLPDPDRHLSKRHCMLAFRSGRWELSDLSANGTFLNRASAPIGSSPATLSSGDRFRLGVYEIEVGIDADRDLEPPRATSSGRSNFGLFDDDPAPGPAERPDGGIAMRDDFNPFASDDDFPLREPARQDHRPVLEDAFRPPPRPAAAIPDDWDLELSEPGLAPPASRPSSPSPPPPRQASAPEPPPVLPPVPPPQGGDALLVAFLRGAGMEDAAIADPERMLEAMGAALRATVAGVRETMIARASIKGEFRIEQTMIRSSGNNPLKFSAGDDDALAALLGAGGRKSMPADQALAEALSDIRLHELATMSATQTAIRALLALLAPATIEKDTDKGGLAVLPAQKKARAWDAFEAAHAKITGALSDDFDSVFGKNFARAYEQSLRELQDHGRRA
jgi:type VI secretion system protein ImpI/type VI secretion system protein